MSLSLNEILITNSPSKRKVLEIFSNGAILSKPNQLDIPDRYYSFEEIKIKGWKKEEKVIFDIDIDYNSIAADPYEAMQKQREKECVEFLKKRWGVAVIVGKGSSSIWTADDAF